MNCKILPILSVLFALLIMAGCKDSVPDNIIQPGEMEDILYDYHVAQSMANGRVSDNLPYQERLYRDAVFKKYDITSADFDSSMVYYMRHTQILKGIYGNLAKRLSDDALKLGASADEVNRYTVLSNNGDTANIWAGEKSYALVPVPPLNKMTFRMQADTTFKKGDSFLFRVNAMFLYQDGMKDATAMLAVRYDNDSVATQIMHMSMPQTYDLQVLGDEKHNIKEISGFVYLAAPDANSSKTTLKLLLIDKLKLIRFHVTDKDKNEQMRKAHQDSINAANGNAGGMPGAPGGAMPMNGNGNANGVNADSIKQQMINQGGLKPRP